MTPLNPPRLAPILLVMGALVFACGPRTRASDPPAAATAAPGEGLGAEFGVSAAGEVRFALSVTNHASSSLELVFPGGQTHDFVVVDSTGRAVWRWSDGRVFTQAMQSRVLGRREALAYRASWQPSGLRGTFEAVASLNSDNHPVERRARFSIP